jgi:DNA polymerase III epsilon subunit-like protein
LGIACRPHYLFDTLELARQLYPIWPSHSLENIAIRLHVAGGREHRALPDARLVKDVFLELLQRTPTVKSIADLVHISPTYLCRCTNRLQPATGALRLTHLLSNRAG